MNEQVVRAASLPFRTSRQMLALGVSLAVRGWLAGFALALAAAGAIAALVAALTLRHAAARLPTWTSKGVAWSGGLTLAFGVALRALQRDKEQGVRALVRARGITRFEYANGRVGGLVIVLAAMVGGATLVAGFAATAAGGGWESARSSAGALAYALVFAIVLGPVAMAAMGPRTRTHGYLALVAMIVLPELMSPWTSRMLPDGWHELTSIPAALDAVAGVFAGPPESRVHAARAIAGLGAVIVLSVAMFGIGVARAEAERRS